MYDALRVDSISQAPYFLYCTAGSPSDAKEDRKFASKRASGLRRFVARLGKSSTTGALLGPAALIRPDDPTRSDCSKPYPLSTPAIVDASIAHLLTSNDAPSDLQAKLVLETIAEIAKANADFKWSVKSRALAKDQNQIIARALGRVLSSVRRLPPEIIYLILSFAAMTDSQGRSWEHSDRTVSNSIPWNVSHVSRLWRTCALAAPDLWRHFPRIHLSDYSFATQSQIELFEELVRRSHLFDICIDDRRINQPNHPIIRLICLHSEKLLKLNISCTLSTMRAFKALKGNLPVLSVLRVGLDDSGPPTLDHNNGFRVDPIATFSDAPALQHVYLGGPCVQAFQLPAQSLIHITTSRPLSDLSGLVYSNLTTLILRNEGSLSTHPSDEDDPWQFASNIVRFPLLRRLEFESNRTDMLVLVCQMSCPVLEEITALSDTGNILAMLSALVMNSHSPPISEMFIRMNRTERTVGELCPLLEQTPTLTRLDMTLPHAEDLRDLSLPLNNPRCLVPHLQSCSFFIIEPMSREEGRAILDLAEVRCEVGGVSHADAGMALRIECNGQARPVMGLRYFSPFLPTLQQAILEPWYSDTPLTQLALELSAAVPCLYHIYPSSQIQPPVNVKRIRKILQKIEGYKSTDAQEIMVSTIHHMAHPL